MADELTPDAKTFDIADMFTGKAYPKEVVAVYMDEDLAYRVGKLNRKVSAALLGKDRKLVDDLTAELDGLYEQGKNSRYEFHLTGVSRKVRTDIVKAVKAKFPPEKDFLGRET